MANFWGIALGVAMVSFALGFGFGAFVIRRSIQKYGIHETHYEKNLAAYKRTLLRSMDDGLQETRALIDHFFWRLVQACGALIVLFFLVRLAFLRLAPKP